MVITLSASALVIGGVCLLLFSAVAFIQEKRFFTSAPKDIQEVIQEKEERFPGARLLGYLLAIVSLFMILAAVVISVRDGRKKGFTFRQYFVRFLTIFYTYKAFDMVCLDYFLLMRSHFFQHYYPETEGCEGFKHYGFNRKSQLTRIAVYPIIAAVEAAICSWLFPAKKESRIIRSRRFIARS